MLYHTEIFVPKELQIKLKYLTGKVVNLTYTRHAILAANEDRYGAVNLLSTYTFNPADIIELETDQAGNLIKILVRIKYDKTRDICMAILAGGRVKTLWLNLASDKHQTLDRTRYVAS